MLQTAMALTLTHLGAFCLGVSVMMMVWDTVQPPRRPEPYWIAMGSVALIGIGSFLLGMA